MPSPPFTLERMGSLVVTKLKRSVADSEAVHSAIDYRLLP